MATASQNSNNKVQASLTLPPELLADIKERAKVESRTFTNMIEVMAKQYLEAVAGVEGNRGVKVTV